MSTFNRRHFLSLAGAAGAASLTWPASLLAEPRHAQDFDFVFFTDTHLQPELNATAGCDMAFKKIRDKKIDFAIQGGDHIFDALGVPKERSLSLFDAYEKTQQDIGIKVYHTIGNHDCMGIYAKSGLEPTDPLYGKKYYEDHFAKAYYSFDHKGVHFVVLDSIWITPERQFEGRIGADQLAWLAQDLKSMPAGTPVIVSSHVPIVSAVSSYEPEAKAPSPRHAETVANSKELLDMFDSYHVLGVLQGHTHINERVEWHGVPYITSGAVSGNWWRGTRWGTPEGYTVVSLRGGRMTTRYETYGFKSVDPSNS